MQTNVLNNKPVVLYADDDADDRSLLTDALDLVAPGFIIDTVEDGFKALAYLNTKKPHLPCLLILDLNMPGMNGKEVIQIIKNDPALESLPIVAFSTSSNPQDVVECANYGVDMITKPITFAELQVTLKKMLSYCNEGADL